MPDIKFINSPRTKEKQIKFTRRIIEQDFSLQG